MPLFDCMMEGELSAERFGEVEKCVNGLVDGAFVVAVVVVAGAVYLVPHHAEIVMLRKDCQYYSGWAVRIDRVNSLRINPCGLLVC